MKIQKYITTRKKKENKPEIMELEERFEAIPLEFKEGERGWFCYRTNDPKNLWCGEVTSQVVKITETDSGFEVETKNSIYTFEQKKEN